MTRISFNLRFVPILPLLLFAMPLQAKDKPGDVGKYSANVIVQGGDTRPTTMTVQIYRWSTDEEHGEFVAAIKKATADGSTKDRAVAKALRRQDTVGYYFFGRGRGYPLRYANSIDLGGGLRRIILATDRPISSREINPLLPYGDRDSWTDFDVTLIVLNVDEADRGGGLLSLGTEIQWNDREGKADMTNISTQPIKLGDVRPVE